MNILIIYPFYNQKALMHNFASKLRDYKICVDFICVDNYTFERNTSINWPFFIEWGFNFINKSTVEPFKRLLKHVLYKLLLKKLFKRYDLIDFHAYYPSYNNLIDYCKIKKIRFDITLWGSELMRADENRKELMRIGFDSCYRIKMTKNLYNKLVEFYGEIYKDKCKVVWFGNNEMPIIDSLSDDESEEITKNLYGKIGQKRIIVCGYNGSHAQNHQVMIDALNHLNKEEKDALHVVLPMTYGASPEYIDEIKSIINNTKMSYSILRRFLEPKEVAAIRKTADIVLNIQDTDAFAGSIKGHLYCEKVCIFGEWLNYDICDENGIFYIKTSKDGVLDNIKEVLSNYDKYKKLCCGNHDKLNRLFSWEITIKDQVLAYGE